MARRSKPMTSGGGKPRRETTPPPRLPRSARPLSKALRSLTPAQKLAAEIAAARSYAMSGGLSGL